MSIDNSSEHFKQFAASLATEIEKYGNIPKDEQVANQKRQVELLASLETQFRQTLIKHKWGPGVYKAFVTYICDINKNILDARPFFRERHPVFTKGISKALKKRNWRGLLRFHINWRFITFALSTFKWSPGCKIVKLSKEIEKARWELVEMNLPLAISRSRIFWSRTPKSHLSFMDLVQTSAEGLLAAVDKFKLPYTEMFKGVIVGRCVGNMIQCLDQDTILTPCEQQPKTIKDFKPGDRICGVNGKGQRIETEVVALYDHGMTECYEVMFENGYSIVCSEKHKFLTSSGMVPIKDIHRHGREVFCDPSEEERWKSGQPTSSRGLERAVRGNFPNSERDDETQEDLRKMPRGSDRGSKDSGEEDGGREYQPERMGFVVRDSFSYQKQDEGARRNMFNLRESIFNEALGRSSEASEDGQRSEHQEGRVEKSLRYDFLETEEAVSPQRNLRILCSGSYRGKERQHQTMAKGTSGTPYAGWSFVDTVGERSSEGDSGIRSQARGSVAGMAQNAPGRECKDNLQSPSFGKTSRIQTRVSVERTWDSNLGDNSDTVRQQKYGTKISGFCISGSQDMDRSGRILALQHSQEDGKGKISTTAPSGEGRDVKQGSQEETRCNVDTSIRKMFSEENQERDGDASERMEGMAYSDAPLTSTGDLVLRRIVSYRPVGKRRTYDIEVSSPEHNFLLPGGIVTSNSYSLTMLHLYPSDRRKIYRANKFISKHPHGGFEVEDLVKSVNEDALPRQFTSPDEISDLIAAASTVSSDTKAPGDDDVPSNISRYEAPEECRPDVRFENAELLNALHKASNSLSLLDKKLLRLKGIDINLEMV